MHCVCDIYVCGTYVSIKIAIFSWLRTGRNKNNFKYLLVVTGKLFRPSQIKIPYQSKKSSP